MKYFVFLFRLYFTWKLLYIMLGIFFKSKVLCSRKSLIHRTAVTEYNMTRSVYKDNVLNSIVCIAQGNTIQVDTATSSTVVDDVNEFLSR